MQGVRQHSPLRVYRLLGRGSRDDVGYGDVGLGNVLLRLHFPGQGEPRGFRVVFHPNNATRQGAATRLYKGVTVTVDEYIIPFSESVDNLNSSTVTNRDIAAV